MTLIVLPFFTQVIVFLLFLYDEVGARDGELVGLDEAMGLGESLAIGELDGVGVGDGITISDVILEEDGVGVALATATGTSVGNKSLSYETFPREFFTLAGKLSGSGVSDRCFITERTSGRKFGNTCSAP